jgi:transcriptional regulator with XRE-family HTH domain
MNPIYKYRKANNLTQEALARELGLTKATISRYESGDRKPSVKHIVRIESSTGISRYDLRPDIYGVAA